MFSKGQLVFAVLFALTFIVLIIFSYRKDRKIHLKQYKGTIWVFLGFLLFVTFLLAIKYFAKK